MLAHFAASDALGLMTVLGNGDRWDASNVVFRDGVLLCYDKHRRRPDMAHVDYGAALSAPGSAWQSAVMTALTFGYLGTAEALARRGAPLNHLAVVAGLGRLEETIRLLPAADSQNKHAALALAAQHGHADVVRLLLDAGEDPNRYNPDGFHSHFFAELKAGVNYSTHSRESRTGSMLGR